MKTKIEYHVDGKIIKAVYVVDDKGIPQGDFENYYENGRLETKGTYRNGEEDGLWEYFYENGRLWKKCAYKNGEKDGLYATYYENGQLGEKCFYKNGKKDGPYISYREDGRLDTKYIYKNGERLDGEKAKKYLKEWKERHQSPRVPRKILSAGLAQLDKQTDPTRVRQ